MTTFDVLAGTLTGVAGEQPPLVLLHGLTFDRRQWGPLLHELPGRRALALDLPGHGESPQPAEHSRATLAELVHRAVTAAGLDAPVVVGHSAGGVLATAYAARFPAAAVVNLDQPLVLGGFGDLLHRVEPVLRGPGWRDVWDRLLGGMGIEALPAGARDLVESCVPRQDQLLGYWDEILRHPNAVVDATSRAELTTVVGRGIGYHFVTSDPGPQEWLPPQATITVLPGGHFPHLAHPRELAALLAR